MTSLTLENHVLSDGFVVRGVETGNDGVIRIRSFGEGINRRLDENIGSKGSFVQQGANMLINDGLRLFNIAIARPGFTQLDNNIRRQVLSRTSDGRDILSRERANALNQRRRSGRDF